MSRDSDSPEPRWGHLTVPDDFGYDFAGTRRWQAALGLTMTPAERFRWLEETVAEMQTLVGLARKRAPGDSLAKDTAGTGPAATRSD